MKAIGNILHFESGRTVEALLGVVGLDVDDLTMCYGCDGVLGECEQPFTPVERIEIAEFMIDRWKEVLHRAVRDAAA